jgi:hypothetical protein
MRRYFLFSTSHLAFDVVFALFAAAMLVLIVLVLRWAIRRDRAGRAAWRERTAAASGPPDEGSAGR